MTLKQATELAGKLPGSTVEFVEELGYYTVVTNTPIPEISELLQQEAVEIKENK